MDVSVDFTVTDGTAEAGTDFVAASGTVTIAAGNTLETVSIDILGDFEIEPDETFTVTLSNPSPADVMLADDTAVVTIENDDAAPEIVGGATAEISLAEGQTDVIDIAATDDDDAEGSGLTFTLSGSDADAFSVNSSTGEITFDTAPDFEVPTDLGGTPGDNIYTVSVTVTDSTGESATQALTVTVTDVNEAPTAVSDFAETDEDTVVSGNVITGTLPDGDGADQDPDMPVPPVPLLVSGVNGEAISQDSITVAGSNGGQFTINSNGNYSFNPVGFFDVLTNGESVTTSIQYTVTDGEFESTATLTIAVAGENDPPRPWGCDRRDIYRDGPGRRSGDRPAGGCRGSGRAGSGHRRCRGNGE